MRASSAVAVVLLLAACGGPTATPPPSGGVRTPGPLGDTWTGDGTTWHQADGAGPAPRYSASLAFDPKHHDFVLFGGQTTRGSSDETWTWDAGKWTAMTPVHKPPPRRSAAMAYDPAHEVVVLYGGLVEDKNEGFAASDTWTWDGSDWRLISPKTQAPGDREGPRMVTAGNTVLVFGGRWYNIKYFGDTWTWDGAKWSRIDHNPTPAGRANAALVWNPLDSSLFVYGGIGLRSDAGIGALGSPLGDAWSFKNGLWSGLKATGPPKAANGNAFWDQKTGRAIIAFGITCPNPINEVWAWDGTKWLQQAPAAVPARWGASSAQDDKGNVLVFGGSDEAGC